MRRVRTMFAALAGAGLAVVGFAVAVPGPAHAATSAVANVGTPGPHHLFTRQEWERRQSGQRITWIQIWNLNSGYVLGVSGGRQDNGAPIIQWEDNYQTNGLPARDQAWAFTDDLYGQLNIRNANTNPMKAMGISGSSRANGARAIQWDYVYNLRDQQWSFRWISDTIFYLKNNESFSCIGVNGGSKAMGASVIQWDCPNLDIPDQRWYAYVYP